MELHVHFLPGRVNSPGFETLSNQLVANAHILRLCRIIADTLSWGVQRQSNQYNVSPTRTCHTHVSYLSNVSCACPSGQACPTGCPTVVSSYSLIRNMTDPASFGRPSSAQHYPLH